VTLESLIDADAALGLSTDRLALHLLHDINAKCQAEPTWQPHRYNFLNSAYAAYSNAGMARDQVTAVTQALAEAYDWLLLHGLLAVAPRDNQGGWLFLTRKGEAVLAAPNGVQLVQAEARIGLDLHPRIAARIRSKFLLGEHELAAFAAMREVEIRVRELAGTVADVDLNRGVKLMTRAFNANESGLLVDASSERGERVAMMNLFQGAIGVFKNPPSHRQVDYADPTIASEIVLLADLLLRMLDDRAAALGLTSSL
jgi:uncharacterized protein (TIGR02391 family)